jgi:hypothetical protein
MAATKLISLAVVALVACAVAAQARELQQMSVTVANCQTYGMLRLSEARNRMLRARERWWRGGALSVDQS